jgi:hypothetical protein
MTRVPAWRIWQVRFWDTASGEAVRQIASSEFTFVAGAHRTEQQTRYHFLQQTRYHFLKVNGDTLLITEQNSSPRGPHVEDGRTPVACFRAPQEIASMHCRGTTICVGCSGGAVCILQAPFLAT